MRAPANYCPGGIHQRARRRGRDEELRERAYPLFPRRGSLSPMDDCCVRATWRAPRAPTMPRTARFKTPTPRPRAPPAPALSPRAPPAPRTAPATPPPALPRTLGGGGESARIRRSNLLHDTNHRRPKPTESARPRRARSPRGHQPRRVPRQRRGRTSKLIMYERSGCSAVCRFSRPHLGRGRGGARRTGSADMTWVAASGPTVLGNESSIGGERADATGRGARRTARCDRLAPFATAPVGRATDPISDPQRTKGGSSIAVRSARANRRRAREDAGGSPCALRRSTRERPVAAPTPRTPTGSRASIRPTCGEEGARVAAPLSHDALPARHSAAASGARLRPRPCRKSAGVSAAQSVLRSTTVGIITSASRRTACDGARASTRAKESCAADQIAPPPPPATSDSLVIYWIGGL